MLIYTIKGRHNTLNKNTHIMMMMMDDGWLMMMIMRAVSKAKSSWCAPLLL